MSWVRGTLPRPSRRPWVGWGRARRRHPPTPRPTQPPVPLPVPHPVTVALIIYNRDADSPVSLDSDICIDILRTIEEASPDADNTQGISPTFYLAHIHIHICIHKWFFYYRISYTVQNRRDNSGLVYRFFRYV